MANGITIKIIDHSGEVLDELEDAVKRALKMCGQKAQDNATTIITENGSVVTGLLRNSIAYALGGETPTPHVYADDNGEQNGRYKGNAPNDEKGKYTVYIGTNVEYGKYVELGVKSKGRDAKPFLEPALTRYIDKYKRIIKEELGG